MTNSQIMDDLTTLFRSVLAQPALNLHRSTTANDVAGWDSLNHAILLAQVQKHFKVKFAVKEVITLRSVGELADLVAAKCTANN